MDQKPNILQKPKKNPQSKISSYKELHVKIHAPFNVYYDGQAISVSAENDTGPFDILPKHHNFMTLLGVCELIVRTKQDIKKFKITRGILHVKADNVIVFLDV